MRSILTNEETTRKDMEARTELYSFYAQCAFGLITEKDYHIKMYHLSKKHGDERIACASMDLWDTMSESAKVLIDKLEGSDL